MGINCMFSSSSYDSGPERTLLERTLPNPNPKNYKFKKHATIMSRFLIVWVNYPDCDNYEGNKIMVYKDCSFSDLKAQGHLDPHFSENKRFHSPIARFVPTAEGWRMAATFAFAMDPLA